MPNIYLRMPSSRCAYFRHRDHRHTLAPEEPVVYSQYTQEYFIMRNTLTNAPAVTQEINEQCFSHQQWRNMMSGRHPAGGRVAMKRDRNKYLSFAEVCHLSGRTDYHKSINEDYLCVRLPTEIEVVDTVRTVTPSWNLTTQGVRQLIVLLNNDFKRSLVEWALATFDYCTADGRIVCRGQSAMLERYLMRYGIEPTADEKDNLRRIIDRWLRSEHSNFKSYSCIDMTYPDSREKSWVIDDIQWLD